ncbi:hypothetical protein ESO86_16210 [Agromyces binzhouensis]|uniref:Uncharacterized protein n=1 Tax=Agromyces binzhouensis TaxID=1817495 RepID=A0A4Q2J894_9MICO|nr:hypothetical protein ESO86_16210 [Agromyces binzhouensis]
MPSPAARSPAARSNARSHSRSSSRPPMRPSSDTWKCRPRRALTCLMFCTSSSETATTASRTSLTRSSGSSQRCRWVRMSSR